MPLVMGLSALASALHQTLSAPFYRSPSISQGSADFPPRLPLELCEAIIDYCSNDLCTLRACTLVCHAWVRRAQKHIFSRTCLRTSKLRFTQTLLTANPTLAAYIQHLTVDFGGTDTLVNVRDMLKSVCQHMESVQALRLTGISLPASLELNLLRTVLPKRTTRLELGKITVAPQAPLPALIASFPLLQDLSLGENLSSVYGAATWVAAGPITVRLRAPLQTLRLSLAFSNPAVLNYAQWLAAGPHTLDLRTLCVAFDYSGTRINAPATLGLLLDTLGPPLETLELAMARDTDLNVIPFTLERAARLTHLHLLVRYSGSWTQDSPSAVRNWVVTLLSRVYQPSIRTIHLAIEDPGEEGYLFFDWVDDLVNAVLQADGLSSLLQITVESAGSCLAASDAASFERRLDLLRQKTTIEHVCSIRP